MEAILPAADDIITIYLLHLTSSVYLLKHNELCQLNKQTNVADLL